MDTWKCPYCRFVYDPGKGFPVDGIKPGTPFAEVPAEWVCPVCGASKGEFVPVG